MAILTIDAVYKIPAKLNAITDTSNYPALKEIKKEIEELENSHRARFGYAPVNELAAVNIPPDSSSIAFRSRRFTCRS